MKRSHVLALAAVLLPLSAHATSLKLPAMDLTDRGAALTEAVGNQFYQVAIQARDYCTARYELKADLNNCYQETFVTNSDPLYTKMGVSQDATVSALIDVMLDKQNPQRFYNMQQAGYVDLLITTINAIQSPKVAKSLIDNGYLSEATVAKLQ